MTVHQVIPYIERLLSRAVRCRCFSGILLLGALYCGAVLRCWELGQDTLAFLLQVSVATCKVAENQKSEDHWLRVFIIPYAALCGSSSADVSKNAKRPGTEA